ncbi:energy transducer TonB [Aestuariibaculum sp. YM273]|uniref:energy transducer TonB n=1 Tax=Aestuariibaculum sp. YM273 TaxID=3070659 RepID=UPI0027DBB2CF|nr:energy transducer TonB [Aestuariibaculum sp. YM273]WMI66963.1 energy transducer TonB [Aestuariibaculum sp. YM273]
MSNSKNTHDLIRQNEQIVKKSQKHEANVQKNTTLYFQIGLIVCLLSAYGLLEMKFESELPKDYGDIPAIEINEEIAIENIKVLEENITEPVQKNQEKVVLYEEPNVVDNDIIFEEPKEIVTAEQNTTPNEDLAIGDIDVVEAPVDNAPVDFIRVEQVPIYPGCEKEKDNEGRKKCMSDKIKKLVQKKFNTGLGGDLGLSGRQVIFTRFTIDRTGQLNDLQIRAPHPELEKEAERVIEFIPQMEPGKQRDKSVNVIYNLPIVFQVQD